MIVPENNIMIRGNKKTATELNENLRIRKQNRREKLKESYADEERNKLHAAELAKKRADKRS